MWRMRLGVGAMHPGPGEDEVTKKEAEKQAKAASCLAAWLRRKEHSFPNALSKAKGGEAYEKMKDVATLMEEMAKAIDDPELPRAFACPLCYDTEAQREEQIRAGNSYAWKKLGPGERSLAALLLNLVGPEETCQTLDV